MAEAELGRDVRNSVRRILYSGSGDVAHAASTFSNPDADVERGNGLFSFTRELLRSELFGHERGAFTGAVSRTAGLVSRVDGGTLFMDEIGELPTDTQAMLLRFLQEGEGRPVGAARSITVDVRVIAATHQDLEAGVKRGTFREDVYYRLWWAVLEVPPLRARREDIALLVEHFRSEVNHSAALFVALIVAWQLAATVFRLRDYLVSAANDSYAPNIRGAGQP